jgi:hypothetical protein
VRAIADVATAVTKGDLTRFIQVEAKGEVAALKDNINEMIRNLKDTTIKNNEQDWLKTNLAKFTRMLQGQKDMLTVGKLILSELAPVVGAQHGVFYIMETPTDKSDPEKNESFLKLLASYAYRNRKRVGNRFALGEIDGSDTPRVRDLSAGLRSAGLRSPVLKDIRSEIWLKLWGNLSFNPISALTHATLVDLCQYPLARELARDMMLEAQAVANKLGRRLRVTIDRRSGEARRNGRLLELQQTPLRLLLALAEAWPRTLTRSELVQRLWGDDPPRSDPLRSHLYLLRQALASSFETAMLRTVHGVGFRLEAES